MDIDKFTFELKEKFSDYFGKDISEKETIREFLHFFIKDNNDFLVIDFFDSSNWDSILNYSYNLKEGEFEAVWYDFGSNIQKLYLKVDLVKLGLLKNKYPYLLLRGFSLDDKEINKKWNTKCTEFERYKINLFSEEIRRVVKGRVEIIVIPNVNIYSTIIVPRLIDTNISQSILFFENKKLAIENLKKQSIKLDKNMSRDEIKGIANSVRSYFEHCLKIFALKINHEFYDEKGNLRDYQKLMLGDLVKPFKDTINDKELEKN